jgi:AcrR family transcriptional regulator
MAPRAYSMERRARQVAATRERILDAAAAAYREHGIRGTSMQEVARRADVAPGTVLNHFATPAALAVAVLDRIQGSLEVPDTRVFHGIRSRSGRIRRLVSEMFAFYDRSQVWYEAFQAEIDDVPALQDGLGRFWASIHLLYGEVFGPLLDDARLRGTVFGLTNPATLGALREAGLSLGQSAQVIGDLLVGLVDRAARAETAPRPRNGDGGTGR